MGGFRTYGFSPTDWYEGANLGHAFEVRFEKAPTAAAKKQLAELFEERMARGPAQASPEPWLWSGPWAYFLVGEREGDARDTFTSVEATLRAMHRAWPLAEAIFVTARASALDEDEPPTDGPEYPGIECLSDQLFGRKRNPRLAKGAADKAFEAARLAARPKPAVERPAAPAKPGKPGKLALAIAEAGDFNTSYRPQPAELPPWVAKAMPQYLYSLALRAGSFLLHGGGKGGDRLLWLRERKQNEVPIADIETPHAALRPDGMAVLVHPYLGEVVSEWTAGGKLQPVFTGASIWGAAYTRDGFVVSAGDQLLQFAKVGDRKPVAKLAVKRGGALVSLFGGDALVMCGEKALHVFDSRGGKLAELGSIKVKGPGGLVALDDEVYFTKDDDHAYYTLTGLAPAFA